MPGGSRCRRDERRDAEHEPGGHRGPEHQAEHVERRAGARLRLAEQRHPEGRDRHQQPGHGSNDRPARRCQTDAGGGPWHELQDPAERVRGRAEDVHHERDREAAEPVVGRDDGRSAGELDQPQRPGRQGGRAQHDRATGTSQLRSRVLIGSPLRDQRRRRRTDGLGLPALIAPQRDAEADLRNNRTSLDLATAPETGKPAHGRLFEVGDTGLEPVTSALSRRRSPS